MTAPVDQRGMMIVSLSEVQKAIAIEDVVCRMRSILRRRGVSEFHIRDKMEPPATCVLQIIPVLT